MGQLSRKEDRARTSRQRKRSSGSRAFAGSCSATFWRLASGATDHCCGLRMTNETIRIATGMRLGISICEPHLCPCGKQVESRGIRGLSCRHSAARISPHNTVIDIIWRAMQKAKIPAAKEPPGLLRSDNKRSDGVTLIAWKQGKCLAWDVTM